MVNHGVDIKTNLIGVLDLAEDFPGHVRMGFSRRGLHLRVDAEFHGPPELWMLQDTGAAYLSEANSIGSKAELQS